MFMKLSIDTRQNILMTLNALVGVILIMILMFTTFWNMIITLLIVGPINLFIMTKVIDKYGR